MMVVDALSARSLHRKGVDAMNSAPYGSQLSKLVARNRSNRGSMLAFIVATLGIVVALTFFGLNYVRLL